MTNTETATLSPARRLAVDTDTARAELDATYAKLDNRMTAATNDVRRLAGAKRRQVTRTIERWDMTVAEAMDNVTAKLESGTYPAYDAPRAQRSVDAVNRYRSEMDANRDAAAELDQVWADNGRWSRFFLVQASNGHIHTDISAHRCSRTNTTAHAWLPELSGLTESDAVAAYGPLLCSVCFPEAPVEWTLGKPKAPRCSGSVKAGTTWRRGMKSYAECTECGTQQIRTTSGLRAHKPSA